MKNVVEVSCEYGGRTLTLQTGKLAKQADASVLGRYGDTIVLVAVVSSKVVKENQEFFPLTVDFQEKYYAAGRIPGGFFKREAKPTEKATLSARLIDRPIRPLFPEDFLCETNVTVTVLSIDPECDPDLVAGIATSAALHLSDIPWSGPIVTCRVGWVNDQPVINPSNAQLLESRCELTVAGVQTGLIMVEGSAKEVTEKEMMDALDAAHESMKPIFKLQDELREKTGNKEKREYPKPVRDEALKKKMKDALWGDFTKAFATKEKLHRYEALGKVAEKAEEKFCVKDAETPEDAAKNKLVGIYIEEIKGAYARELTLSSSHRIDGRAYDAIRPITCEIGLLPRVHGTGLFTRGETQVLSSITLGTADDEQKIDSPSGIYQKTFLLHYNFPPFSVGEAKPLRPPGRREVGHGFLAERALSYVIPPKDKFPYTIRLVAEVLESNGSSSMATVCSGSMALMDAGVPITKPVAGVAMGLIKEGDRVAVLSDILGDEDHLGDMDFKVCGTAEGITAFQMDLKIGGVSREIMEKALAQAKDGRMHILEKMAETIQTHKEAFSPYAPRIFTIKVKPEKVREVIGSGGKVIRSIIERTGVKIDIEDDGSVNIASSDTVSAQKAIDIINQIVEEPEPGKIYEGRVSRIADFGAFVEIIPGTDGLCHISELDLKRVRRVEDVVREGEIIRVKCLEVDSQGKIRLSRKALLTPETASATEGSPSEGEGAPPRAEARDDRGRDDHRRDRGDRDRGGRGGGDRGGRGRFGGGGRSGGGGGGGGDRGRGRFSRDRSDEGSDRFVDRGNDREDRGSDRGNDRGNDRGFDREDRGNDRGNERGFDREERAPRFTEDRGNREERPRDERPRSSRGYDRDELMRSRGGEPTESRPEGGGRRRYADDDAEDDRSNRDE